MIDSIPSQMERENHTEANNFVIVGFVDVPQLQAFSFAILLLAYLITLVGNLLIMAIVYLNIHLHTPMYLFLTNLSFLDINCTTIILPKLLVNFFKEKNLFSLTECLLQIYFLLATLSTELILLAVMAYDRYVAVCNPLRYGTIMSKDVCIRLAVGTWIVGLTDSIPHTVLLSGLSFCSSHTINHFFCDVSALMTLSCSSTRSIETSSYILGSVIVVFPFLLVVVSYVNILMAILKIKSIQGRWKAFSTCSSHLTVVILFYGSLSSAYIRPTSTFSMNENKLLSLSYTVLTPFCNPFIYTLKNKDFKSALRKAKTTM
ncbi:olfactory receptor 1L4-like [Lissotriton helveticus]